MLIPRHWRAAEGSAQEPGGRRLALRVWGWRIVEEHDRVTRAGSELPLA